MSQVREPRPSCGDCGRPLVAWVRAADGSRIAVGGVCFCDRVTVLPTRTRILFLQHPREHDVAIGTARMAHRALPSSRLRVGLDFGNDPEFRATMAGAGETYLLFPGPDAMAIEQLPRDRDVKLIVLDGTWSQAKKLLRLNPRLGELPRVGFIPSRPSAYVIRREPADFCVSTIEALAHVLAVLEPDGGRFAKLLDPFHAMVERQRWFEAEVGASRHRFVRRMRVSPRASLASRLSARWSRLVCVHGEANAWPHHHPARQEPETVHWVAHRAATAETFEAVVAPRQALAPDTPDHIELSPERLRSGSTVRQWHEAWNDFARPDDILVTWGSYYRRLAVANGLSLASPSIDLRAEVIRIVGRRFGTIEGSMDALDATAAPIVFQGRGGRRLAALVGALGSLRG